MEDLKMIWGKLNDLQEEVGKMINVNVVEDTYQTLKKEEENHKKYTPWMIPYILILMGFMTWLTEAYQSTISMVGILLITIGGFVMTYLLSTNRIPIEQYEHGRDATSFLKIVQEKLLKRKQYWPIAVAIYTLSLLAGLHLLIFGLESVANRGGEVGILYGVMLGLTGMVTGSMYAMHQSRYGDLLKRIDRFLAD